jgi:hypothetical protein
LLAHFETPLTKLRKTDVNVLNLASCTRLVWPGKGARRTGLGQPLIVVMVVAHAATAAGKAVVMGTVWGRAANMEMDCSLTNAALENLISNHHMDCKVALWR